MKKAYQTPVVKVVFVQQKHHLLSGSGIEPSSTNTGRASTGGPTTTTNPLGINIFESDGAVDTRSRDYDWFEE